MVAGFPSGLALAFLFPSVCLLLCVRASWGEHWEISSRFSPLLSYHDFWCDIFFSTWHIILKRYKLNIIIPKIDTLGLSFCAGCCRKGAHGDWFNIKSSQNLSGCLVKNKASHMDLSSFSPILSMVAFFWCICVNSEHRKMYTAWQEFCWTQCYKTRKKSHLDFKMPSGLRWFQIQQKADAKN